jgi:hypothetical protein
MNYIYIYIYITGELRHIVEEALAGQCKGYHLELAGHRRFPHPASLSLSSSPSAYVSRICAWRARPAASRRHVPRRRRRLVGGCVRDWVVGVLGEARGIRFVRDGSVACRIWRSSVKEIIDVLWVF